MIIRRKDWLKKRNADFVNSLKNLRTEFPNYGIDLGYTQPEIDGIVAECTNCETDYDDKNAKQIAAEAAVAKFNNTKKSMISILRLNVPRIKSAPKYTENIGKILDIVGEEIVIDPDTMKPVLIVRLLAGKPQIKWVKDYSDGVNIYSKRGDETEFTFLARDNVSPYVDDRPNLEQGKPEDREYYAFYIFDDEEEGLESDTVKITIK